MMNGVMDERDRLLQFFFERFHVYFGPHYVYADEVYKKLVEEATTVGVLDKCSVKELKLKGCPREVRSCLKLIRRELKKNRKNEKSYKKLKKEEFEELVDAKEITESVLFFPSKENELKILSLLLSARTTLKVCVFKLSNKRLISTFAELRRRGVRVRVLTQDSDCGKTAIEEVVASGAELKIQPASEAKLHHKFAIIDNSILLNGSLNWSVRAILSNFENVTILREQKMISSFADEFERLWTLIR
eukprot:TRINITY_DN1759_c0_g1_i3.p1 TRINITY_DN1759_c0_g1~~TRINITY_DN1759_c0_g1_i3.p1  ORF type:complete len:246 (+),score=57.57 TRINITY_DN1759_c0_g1_i3:70-807(+)